MFNRRDLLSRFFAVLCAGVVKPKIDLADVVFAPTTIPALFIFPYRWEGVGQWRTIENTIDSLCPLLGQKADWVVDSSDGKIFGAVWKVDPEKTYKIDGFKVADATGTTL